MGSIRSPAALPRMAVRGRGFLSEHPDLNRVRYYKDGLSNAKPIISRSTPSRWVSLRSTHPTIQSLWRGRSTKPLPSSSFAETAVLVALIARPIRGIYAAPHHAMERRIWPIADPRYQPVRWVEHRETHHSPPNATTVGFAALNPPYDPIAVARPVNQAAALIIVRRSCRPGRPYRPPNRRDIRRAAPCGGTTSMASRRPAIPGRVSPG